MKLTSHPYLTKTEVVWFKRMRDSGELSSFRVSRCAATDCEEGEVPRGQNKFYCCEQCYLNEEGAEIGNGKQDEEETGPVD